MVIGLGNEFMRDDGFGIYALRLLRENFASRDRSASPNDSPARPHIVFRESTAGGFEILDLLSGFTRGVLIDAVVTGRYEPGTIYRHVYTSGTEEVKLISSHQLNLQELLGLAQLYHADVPSSVVVYGMEVEDVLTFSVGCTRRVQEMLPVFVDTVAEELASGRPFISSHHVAEFPRWPSARFPRAADHPVTAS